MSHRRAFSAHATWFALALVGVASGDALADRRADARRLVERVAPATVAVRIVMSAKLSANGQSMAIPEEEMAISGTIVDPSGLVMIGSWAPAIRALVASRPGLKIDVLVRDIRVQIPGEAKERDAVGVVTDASLGLSFVQIVDAKGASFPAVDLSKGATAGVGDEVYAVHRLARGFDYAPEVLRAFVCGRFDQPRPMTLLSGDIQEFGAPIFDGEGGAVGVYVMQFGVEGASSPEVTLEPKTGAVLPLEVVRSSLTQAKARVPEVLAKAAADAIEKPAASPTNPPEKAPGAPPTPAPDPKGPTPPR